MSRLNTRFVLHYVSSMPLIFPEVINFMKKRFSSDHCMACPGEGNPFTVENTSPRRFPCARNNSALDLRQENIAIALTGGAVAVHSKMILSQNKVKSQCVAQPNLKITH